MHNLFISIITVLLIFTSPVFAAETLTAVQIAQRTYDRYLGDDMQMRGSMELIDKNGHVRNREYVSIRKDSDVMRKQVIRFTAPADIDGTSFLNLESDNSSHTEQHLYLPALKRTRRIVASQMARRFVNSDFTYEDMQRHPVADWSYQLGADEAISGYECYVLTSIPNPDTDTQYSKLVAWIEKEHFVPLKTLFFEDEEQAKSYFVNSFELVDTIATETEVLMEDLHSGHITRMKTLEVRYNSGLKDSLFSARSLER